MWFQTNLHVLYISPYSHTPKFFCLSPEPLPGFPHEIVISFPYPHQHSVFLSVNKNKFPSFVCVWHLTLAMLEITAGHQILSTRQSLDMSKQVLWLEVPSNWELLSCEWRSPAKKGDKKVTLAKHQCLSVVPHSVFSDSLAVTRLSWLGHEISLQRKFEILISWDVNIAVMTKPHNVF